MFTGSEYGMAKKNEVPLENLLCNMFATMSRHKLYRTEKLGKDFVRTFAIPIVSLEDTKLFIAAVKQMAIEQSERFMSAAEDKKPVIWMRNFSTGLPWQMQIYMFLCTAMVIADKKKPTGIVSQTTEEYTNMIGALIRSSQFYVARMANTTVHSFDVSFLTMLHRGSHVLEEATKTLAFWRQDSEEISLAGVRAIDNFYADPCPDTVHGIIGRDWPYVSEGQPKYRRLTESMAEIFTEILNRDTDMKKEQYEALQSLGKEMDMWAFRAAEKRQSKDTNSGGSIDLKKYTRTKQVLTHLNNASTLAEFLSTVTEEQMLIIGKTPWLNVATEISEMMNVELTDQARANIKLGMLTYKPAKMDKLTVEQPEEAVQTSLPE
jgi:hypothetical protein